MEKLELKYICLNDLAAAPKKATIGAAAFDLYSSEEKIVPSGKVMLIKTGIAIEIPEGYVGQVCLKGIVVMTAPGLIDSDYRGEVGAAIYNSTSEDFSVSVGDRIAQLLVLPIPEVTIVKTEKLSETHRGGGGFGSTGK